MTQPPDHSPGQTPGQAPGDRFVDAARRYRLDSRIATGGMGEVWRGTDTVLGRPVAVKLLKSEYADDATFRSRFQSEAQHAASLHHPNVAAVYDVGEAAAELRADGSGQPVPFLVMELVDGEPLSTLLRGGRKLSPVAMRDLLAQAADGIGAAHRAGIVHRDVKPANLMVTPERQIKITDFGIARASDGLGLTGTGQVMGTPQYLSPEQARGNPATPASDVYSLGVVAFECLAGHRPFEKESAVATALAHLNDPVPALPDSVPSDLATVVERALAKDPAERYADGDALAAALRDPATAATQLAALPPVVPVPTGADDSTRVMAPAPAVAPVPVTPVDLVMPLDEPVDRRDRRGSGGPSPWWVLVGIVVVGAVIVFLVFRTLGNGDDDTTGSEATTPSATPSTSADPSPSESPTEEETPTEEPSPETFSLDEGDFLGDDVDDVARRLLDDYDLRVQTQSVSNPGDEDEGAVESISPTRDLQAGDTVQVRYYDAPSPEPTEDPTSEAPPTQATTPAQQTPSPQTGQPSTPSGGPGNGRGPADGGPGNGRGPGQGPR